MRNALFGFFAALNDFLHRPWVVFATCLAVAFMNLVFDGTLLRMWSLDRDLEQIERSSLQLRQDISGLEQKLKLAKDPAFLEREAREKFDLVAHGDLVFVFAEDE